MKRLESTLQGFVYRAINQDNQEFVVIKEADILLVKTGIFISDIIHKIT